VNTRRSNRKENIMNESSSRCNFNLLNLVRPRRNLKRRHMRDDFIYDDEEFEEENIIKENDSSINYENGKELVKNNLNIIINKSQILKDYIKDEEERLSATKSDDKTIQKDITFAYNEASKTGNNLLF
jgi:hypothetical protein